VTAPSRRIFAYWLVLLLATLAVGGSAWILLQREQRRLARSDALALESRVAALEARGRLVAENVELLVGDVQNGLLDTLAEVPEPDLAAFLSEWQQGQPLVRVAYLAAPSGALTRPTATAGTDEERGFARRFGDLLRDQPPWNPSTLARKSESEAAEAVDAARREAEKRQRLEVESNTARVQSARKEAQALSKTRVFASSASQKPASRAPAADYAAAPAAQLGEALRPEPRAPDRRGWITPVENGRMHLIGWLLRPGDTQVRGLEIELAALVARLAKTLPVDLAAGEGLALRDERGRVLHRSGEVPPEARERVRIPLSTDTLPGWVVDGYLASASGYALGGTGAFAVVGALLILILMVVIVSAGSLLLWQARRSGAEALQKTSFVANVSHEFKTPLTTIRLYAELLEQGRVAEGPRRQEYLATIGRETQRLGRLVNNALDFSRLEQGRKKYQLEPLLLPAELDRVLATLQPRLAEAGVEGRLDTPPVVRPVHADRDALEQVLLNVIDNACKYAATGGRVELAVVETEQGVQVRVADRGPGVPPAQRERIFEKFHRIDDRLTADKAGAGLGLSIGRQLMRGMGGDLRCEPREGGGAVFVLHFP
jgi:signal transduction histidine kinase